MPKIAKSIEELFPLIEFCKAGNLKEVSEWISQDKPVDWILPKGSKRRSPLQIAIEKGFYSLVELLLDGGVDPCSDRNRALVTAVDYKRVDIVKLLLS